MEQEGRQQLAAVSVKEPASFPPSPERLLLWWPCQGGGEGNSSQSTSDPHLGSRGLCSLSSLLSVPCLKILLSKGLGLGIVAGSLLGTYSSFLLSE